MSMPFYVSPEQLMKDRADFARKGIARGRSLVVVQYADGIVFVSENLSQALHKVSEIYDRIAFAAVGRYNEFENLRIAGVRLADMRGYAYDRRDVTGRGLANAYAQTLGTIFSSGGEKPYEVEIFVAEVGDSADDDSIYRLTYDGQVADEHGFAAMGGSAEPVDDVPQGPLPARRSASTTPSGWPSRRLGQGAHRVPRHPVGEPRGRRPRPHPHPAAQVQAAPGGAARPDPRQRRRQRHGDGPSDGGPSDGGSGGPSTDPSGPDDPADPTDTAGAVPPLEDPVTGEPNGPDDAPVAPRLLTLGWSSPRLVELVETFGWSSLSRPSGWSSLSRPAVAQSRPVVHRPRIAPRSPGGTRCCLIACRSPTSCGAPTARSTSAAREGTCRRGSASTTPAPGRGTPPSTPCRARSGRSSSRGSPRPSRSRSRSRAGHVPSGSLWSRAGSRTSRARQVERRVVLRGDHVSTGSTSRGLDGLDRPGSRRARPAGVSTGSTSRGLDGLDQPGLDRLDQPGLDRLDQPGSEVDRRGLDSTGRGLDGLDQPGSRPAEALGRASRLPWVASCA